MLALLEQCFLLNVYSQYLAMFTQNLYSKCINNNLELNVYNQNDSRIIINCSLLHYVNCFKVAIASVCNEVFISLIFS